MKLLRRRRREPKREQGFPPNAHGCRNLDGSYFAIWCCQNGHGGIGEPSSPPRYGCMDCRLERLARGECPEEAIWTLATPKQACDFMYDLEGLKMYNGVGFTLSEEVLRP